MPNTPPGFNSLRAIDPQQPLFFLPSFSFSSSSSSFQPSNFLAQIPCPSTSRLAPQRRGRHPRCRPIDLRHMTSSTVLDAGRRTSQHLQPTVRKGSRSPSSIPSSPTSVHSSSSAIFERDIEPLHLSPSLALGGKKDPHRIPRSKNTETLEASVPSVLDSAASVLASLSADDDVSVIGPAPPVLRGASGFASPIGSFRSRSPSPSSRANRNSLLLNIPSPAAHGAPPSPTALPTARQFDTMSASSSGGQAHKRLSFISYADLLASTPTSTQPLSALTSPAGSPAHIPGVVADEGGASGAASLRNFGFGGGAGGTGEDVGMDDVGGEWEREGLGRGLEERLEALQGFGMTGTSAQQATPNRAGAKSPITFNHRPTRCAHLHLPLPTTPILRSHPQQHPHPPHSSQRSMTSTGSSSSFSLSLPSPISPTSLSMETPSLGSSDILPRPKRGAPPVAPPPAKKVDPKKAKKDKKKNAGPLDPALCEGW
ncbi:hypothetical protein DFH09DRAFT_1323456 [Mycena vulgaris]|nr:hypothetical protein DFH09DRAFT_1323456 [Mycena vulgaris]